MTTAVLKKQKTVNGEFRICKPIFRAGETMVTPMVTLLPQFLCRRDRRRLPRYDKILLDVDDDPGDRLFDRQTVCVDGELG